MAACCLALNSDAPPITIHPWQTGARIGGALIISPLRLKFITSVCNNILQNIHFTHTTILALLDSKILEGKNDDINFVKGIEIVMVLKFLL